jgi:hypothetical protein
MNKNYLLFNTGYIAKKTAIWKYDYFPIQKIQVTDISRLSEDWATNSQQD